MDEKLLEGKIIVACGIAFDEKFPFAFSSPKKFRPALMNQFQSQAGS